MDIDQYIRSHEFNLKEYSPNDDNKIAVIVETREMPNLPWVIDNISYHTNWKVALFHHDNDVTGICCEKRRLGYNIENIFDYNKLLKSKEFWQDFDEEKILIFQSDSFMLKKGIEQFLDYEYIGAPWGWAYDPKFKCDKFSDVSIFKNGGNGGFSLRSKSLMIDIMSNKSDKYYNSLNEDMFVALYLKEDIGLDIKKSFCVETVFYKDPLAVHAFNKYLSSEQIRIILS